MAASAVYRLVIEPRSPFLTDLQSDTIMGHLAWMAAYRSQTDVTELIEYYRNGTPPFIVSSGFPHDHLPMPTIKPLSQKEKDELVGIFFGDLNEQARKAMLQNDLKKIKKCKYLPIENWRELAGDLSACRLIEYLPFIQEDEEKNLQRKTVVMRTAIDRLTGMASEGRLYDHEELYFGPGCEVDIWFRFFDKGMIKKVETWLEDLSINGFGANASSGAGHFDIISFEKEDNVLPEAQEPNGFMSLSHFSTAADDPINGWYNHIVKRGKLGGMYAPGMGAQANVWKFPIVMFTPGSVFKTAGKQVKDYYGRLIEDIHYIHDSAVQFAYAFPLKIKQKNY